MDASRWQRVSELFKAVVPLNSEDRAAFLDSECDGDAELRAEIEKLLEADLSTSGFFEPVTNANVADQLATVQLDDRSTGSGPMLELEGYKIIRELHRGGQGIVYQAVQESTRRKVAIKVLLEGPYASEAARKRFEREIELVASLKHPNIISIFHSGLTSDRHQFCVMDYVRGMPLNQFVRDQKLPLEDALRLFGKVCDAVNYAHEKGVIHRDLKPANILVDSDGEPKVLDFGLAKMVGGPEQTLISITGQVFGTMPYMSPEQTQGNPDKIDTRTDVYALGVILYEILTGHYPYPVVGQMAEVMRHIAETQPTPPTRKWKADSGITNRSSGRWHVGSCPIDDEVQTIVLRTLSKERDRRYQSAGDLAKDVEHYLAGEPIDAKRDSHWYVLNKGLRRHRIPIAVSAMIAVLLVSVFLALASSRRSQIETLLARGQASYSNKKYLDAVDSFREVLDLRPRHPEALLLASHSLIRKAQQSGDSTYLTEAVKLATRLTESSPTDFKAWNTLCVIQRDRGLFNEAIVAGERAIAINPDRFTVHANLGRAYVAIGDLKSAARKFSRSTELGQGRSGLMGWFNLAAIQRVQGDNSVHKTLAVAEKLVVSVDRYGSQQAARVHALSAMIALDRDDESAAEDAFLSAVMADGALGKNHTQPRIKRILALTLSRRKAPNWSRVLQVAEQAIEFKDPVNSYPHLIAAIAAMHAGQQDRAKQHFDDALSHWPSSLGDSEYLIDLSNSKYIWIDTVTELNALRAEAEALLSE